MIFHYPIAEWNGCYKSAYQLYGHQRNKEYNDENIKSGIRRCDVGVDANAFKPVSFDEIVKIKNTCLYTSELFDNYQSLSYPICRGGL